jgi:hypothetical protein
MEGFDPLHPCDAGFEGGRKTRLIPGADHHLLSSSIYGLAVGCHGGASLKRPKPAMDNALGLLGRSHWLPTYK